MCHKPPLRRNAKSNKHLKLQNTNRSASSDPYAPKHAMDIDKTHRKRKRLPTPWLLGTEPIRIPHVTGLMDTYTDDMYKVVIHNLPELWHDINEKGTLATKRQLTMAAWGEYKDDHNALLFQQAILNTRAHPHTVTQYDTLLAQSVVMHNDVWTRRITNPLTQEQLQHPLQNNINIMQIYNSLHYTTLIADNNKYYH